MTSLEINIITTYNGSEVCNALLGGFEICDSLQQENGSKLPQKIA